MKKVDPDGTALLARPRESSDRFRYVNACLLQEDGDLLLDGYAKIEAWC